MPVLSARHEAVGSRDGEEKHVVGAVKKRKPTKIKKRKKSEAKGEVTFSSPMIAWTMELSGAEWSGWSGWSEK